MRRLAYIYDAPDWPRFHWDQAGLADKIAEVRHQQGRLVGKMENLGFDLRQEAMLNTLTADVLKSSEIEGEKLNVEQVRSSVARRLGMDIGGLKAVDRDVEGVVEMMLDATRRFAEELTEERLWGWHASLFPTGRSGMMAINAGAWRDGSRGPMQVVSGPIGREKVHFQAPSADRVHGEMSLFLRWFNAETRRDWVVNAGIAHLWFVTIHPFDDGNGRIARAIADMALARSERSPQRFYSMSSQIREERKSYYDILARTSSGTMDVTAWLEWFLDCLARAIARSEETLEAVLFKGKFWESVASIALNQRQRAMLNRLLDGFEGKLTSSKWAKLTKVSHDTALRDITFLVAHRIFVQNPGGGRSTSYSLAVTSPGKQL